LDDQKVIRVLVSICLRVGEKKTRNSHLEKSITGKNLKSWLGEVLNSWTLKSFLLMTGLLKTCGCPKLPGGGGEEGKSEREQEREREGGRESMSTRENMPLDVPESVAPQGVQVSLGIYGDWFRTSSVYHIPRTLKAVI
jgi:hypothetical protein